MQIGKHQDLTGLELLLVADYVGQPVVEAGLQRSIGLNLIVWVDVEDIGVVVEDLIFIKVKFSLLLV